MSDSIFPLATLDRQLGRWENHSFTMTPVEEHGGVSFKREDFFAPLGYGGINGSKLRQLIWLFAQDDQKKGVTSGAVSGSPQHVMVAACARHFGMRCVQFVGGSGGKDSEVVSMARSLGAEIVYTNPGYGATLNSKARQLAASQDYLHIETNITRERDHNLPREIEEFHRIGSEQVRNFPDHVETLVLPAGSCNSAVSVLYGIARFRPKSLRHIILMGIGSKGSKDPNYVFERFNTVIEGARVWMEGISAQNLFDPHFVDDPGRENWANPGAPYRVTHLNLNGTGFCKYEQLMPYTYSGIEMHPRYEGKMWSYMLKHANSNLWRFDGKMLFWIVGSAPRKEVMAQWKI